MAKNLNNQNLQNDNQVNDFDLAMLQPTAAIHGVYDFAGDVMKVFGLYKKLPGYPRSLGDLPREELSDLETWAYPTSEFLPCGFGGGREFRYCMGVVINGIFYRMHVGVRLRDLTVRVCLHHMPMTEDENEGFKRASTERLERMLATKVEKHIQDNVATEFDRLLNAIFTD